jgi:hypothetical protein
MLLQRRDGHSCKRKVLDIAGRIGARCEIVDVGLQWRGEAVEMLRRGLPFVKIGGEVDEVAQNPAIDRADDHSAFVTTQRGNRFTLRFFDDDRAGAVDAAACTLMVDERKVIHDRIQLSFMPLTIFDVKGVPGTRRERIETAVVAGAKHLPVRGGVRLLITGANGLQREVGFAMDEEPAVITQLVKMTMDE